MDTPRSGFRRAAVASWALAGIGVAGVAGASTLAYADTVKPTATDAPVVAAVPVAPPEQPVPAIVVETAPVTEIPTTETPPPVLTTDASVPQYTPDQTLEAAPAPIETSTAKSATTTKRRPSTPTTVMAPNYSPHLTVSRGS